MGGILYSGVENYGPFCAIIDEPGWPIRLIQGASKGCFRCPQRSGRHLPTNPVSTGCAASAATCFGDLLYIGKAKSLKKRVTSYFRSKAPHPEHILEMLSQAQNIDFSLTESALEAAVLETDEIKEHCPPYNKALQPNQRSLAFVSRDLEQQGPHSNHQLCIGPLPDCRIADSLTSLWHLVDKSSGTQGGGST
jgi:excinuclease UvrABC nuclease subunit